HDCTASDTGSEAAGSTLKGLLVFKPVVFVPSTLLTTDPLLDSLLLDEFNTGNFVWEPIIEIDNIHGQNRLF
ncbi:hypothetical protein LV84_04289, partial [Algoriphagus ratkowskyi]